MSIVTKLAGTHAVRWNESVWAVLAFSENFILCFSVWHHTKHRCTQGMKNLCQNTEELASYSHNKPDPAKLAVFGIFVVNVSERRSKEFSTRCRKGLDEDDRVTHVLTAEVQHTTLLTMFIGSTTQPILGPTWKLKLKIRDLSGSEAKDATSHPLATSMLQPIMVSGAKQSKLGAAIFEQNSQNDVKSKVSVKLCSKIQQQ